MTRDLGGLKLLPYTTKTDQDGEGILAAATIETGVSYVGAPGRLGGSVAMQRPRYRDCHHVLAG